MMKSFSEINENSKSLKPKELSNFEDGIKAVALPLKYIVMFNDKTINDRLTVEYLNSTDEFTIEVKGEYFKGNKYPVKNHITAMNMIRILMLPVRYTFQHIDDIVNSYISIIIINPKPWDELKPLFIKHYFENFKFFQALSKYPVYDVFEKEFGVTQTMVAAHKYGI